MDFEGLTLRQKKWVIEYRSGKDATEAAKCAGYIGNENTLQQRGHENKIKLAEFIKDRDEEILNPLIADMTEINEFFSATMRNTNIDIKDRLKAAELRAKSAGGFTEKVEVKGTEVVIISGEDELVE